MTSKCGVLAGEQIHRPADMLHDLATSPPVFIPVIVVTILLAGVSAWQRHRNGDENWWVSLFCLPGIVGTVMLLSIFGWPGGDICACALIP